MALEVPPYIPVDDIAVEDIQYEWSEWDPYEPIGMPSEDVENRLENVSNFGITAFALGCAEWVVYRLSRLSADATPLQFIEACWVTLMGFDEALPPESDEDDWQGPVRAAIDLSLMTVLNTVYLAEEAAPTNHGALAAKIATHVLVDPAPFLAWQDRVLERLEKYCARDENRPDGLPVPREILDPGVDLETADRNALIGAFVEGVDFQANPFLADMDRPEEEEDA